MGRLPARIRPVQAPEEPGSLGFELTDQGEISFSVPVGHGLSPISVQILWRGRGQKADGASVARCLAAELSSMQAGRVTEVGTENRFVIALAVLHCPMSTTMSNRPSSPTLSLLILLLRDWLQLHWARLRQAAP